MKNIRINKKTITTAIFTMAVLSSINFAIYPITNSFFKKEEDHVLAFNDLMQDVLKSAITKIEPVITESTPDNIILKVTFDRDEINANDSNKKDSYRIATSKSDDDTNNACTIINKNNINFTINENGEIKFGDTVAANIKNNEVYLSCPTKDEDNKGLNTTFNIKLYERIDEEDEFLYAKGEYDFVYDDYVKNFKDIFKTFKDQYNAYILANSGENNIYGLTEPNFYRYISYFQINMNVSENGDPTRILNSIVSAKENDQQIIPGITGKIINESASNETYEFGFDEYFIGYVETYSFYNRTSGTDRPTSQYLYFSKDNITSYVLEKTIKFMFEDDKQNEAKNLYEYIKTYLNKNDNSTYSMSELKSIPGYQQSAGNYDIQFQFYITDSAYNYLYKENKFRISHYSSERRMNSAFVASIDMMKSNLNSYIVNSINASYSLTTTIDDTVIDSDLYKAITNTINKNLAYYEIHQDVINGKTIFKLLKVETSESDNCNYIYITDLDKLSDSDELINNYITKYLNDRKSDIANASIEDLANIPGLNINTGTTNGTSYKFLTFDSEFMDYADKYVNENIDIIKLDSDSDDNMVQNFISSITAKYNTKADEDSSIVNSIKASLDPENGYLMEEIIDTESDLDYYEIHYNSDTNEYLLIKIQRETQKNRNIITISKLDNDNMVSALNSAYKNNDTIYFHIKKLSDNTESATNNKHIKELLEMLKIHFNIEDDELNIFDDNPLKDPTGQKYNSGSFVITGIK